MYRPYALDVKARLSSPCRGRCHGKFPDMVSLLDIIGPGPVGPSSSHTAGACRIGCSRADSSAASPDRATIELHGSFARTGEGHGTDKAIVAGLMGCPTG